MGSFCGSSDWWPDKWCTDGSPPLLPLCLQYITLAWLPFILIILPSIPYYVYTYWRFVGKKRLDWTVLVLVRLCLVVVIGCCFVAILFAASYLSLVELVSAVISLVFLVPVFVLIVLHLRMGLQSAPPMFYFWLLLFVTRLPLLIRFHNYILMPSEKEEALVSISHFIITTASLIGLVLELFAVPNGKEPCGPEDTSSHSSILFYSWLNPLFLKGIRTSLSEAQVPSLRKHFSVAKIVETFTLSKNKMYSVCDKCDKGVINADFADARTLEEVERLTPNTPVKTTPMKIHVTPIIFKAFGGSFSIAVLLKLCQDILKFIVPQLLGALITFVKNTKSISGEDECGDDETCLVDTECGDDTWKGFFLVALLFLTGVIQVIVLQAYWRRTYTLGLMVRISLFSEIYRKALSLSTQSRRNYTVGEIVTILSTDAQTFNQVIPKLNMVWSMPLQITLSLFFLYREIGVSVFAGVVILIILVPLNVVIGKKSQQQNKNQLKEKDKRIRQLYEILNSIKIIKLYAWESLFLQKAMDIRLKELGFLKKYAVLKSLANFLFGSAPILVTLVSFAVYVSIDKDNILTAEKAFVCLTLFNMLRIPMVLLPFIINEMIRLQVSKKRIDKFLNSEEVNEYVENHVSFTTDITITNASFKWDNGNTLLHDINLSFDSGKMYAIMGPVGCGKSSLLSAILGQMIQQRGSVSINKTSKIAYVSQDAWIQNKTIRENIIFGQVFNEAWYKQVIEACALEDDLDIMPQRDHTMIGENGVNISGGQKQRVSLARAVYRKADLYLLDDPLSAVDVGVANKLINCVLGNSGLLGTKTRLLVTHNLKSSQISDYVIHMEEGRVIDVLQNENKEIAVTDEENILDNGTETLEKIKVEESVIASTTKKDDIAERLKDKKVGTGSAIVKSYKLYFKSVGLWRCFLAVMMYVINQLLVTGSSFWLTKWSDESEKFTMKNDSIVNDTYNEFDNNYFIGVYGGIGISIAIMAFVRNFVLFISGIQASKVIHSSLLWSVIRGKMNFFDTTSTGSIISRFSGDMDTIDSNLPNRFSSWLYVVFEVTAVLVTISVLNPIFIAALVPVFILFYAIKRIYLPTSRQLKRFESSSNAPIYRHFNETIRGVASIKAYGEEQRFREDFSKAIDRNLKLSYFSIMSSRWLILNSELVANLVVLVASLLVVIYRQSVSPGWAGLSISYALSITETFNFVLQHTADLENQATVVERIREAIDHIPQEAEWESEDGPEEGWPQNGKVTFEEYGTKYSEDLDEVLKGLDVVIESGEKIGVVGRTGAGKSSLTLALFRMLEATRGRIVIDDIDISKIGLKELRSVITIIPQDPVLFAGTLRANIDPFDELTEDEVRGVLQGARLDKYTDLDMKVEEDGSNFSAGEKQLICLARALCRHTKVVVMDEATASVDSETDALIQQTIRKAFNDSTVITIAHRLQTVMDCDRIIILEEGKVKEFGNPQELAQDSESHLYKMLKVV